MRDLNMNHLINTTLLLSAIVAGFILTSRTKERDEHPKPKDLPGNSTPEATETQRVVKRSNTSPD